MTPLVLLAASEVRRGEDRSDGFDPGVLALVEVVATARRLGDLEETFPGTSNSLLLSTVDVADEGQVMRLSTRPVRPHRSPGLTTQQRNARWSLTLRSPV
jgi:hypothetical protein